MIEYPKVKHKLPKLFDLIIANHHEIDLLFEDSIVSLNKYKELIHERREYQKAAEKFIQRQKGGTGGVSV